MISWIRQWQPRWLFSLARFPNAVGAFFCAPNASVDIATAREPALRLAVIEASDERAKDTLERIEELTDIEPPFERLTFVVGIEKV